MSSIEENRTKVLCADRTKHICEVSREDSFHNTTTVDLPDMLASLPDIKTSGSFDRQVQQPSPIEKPIDINFSKLSMNLKKYCSIRLRLPQNLSENDLHSLCILNPEYHIKVLEENLKYLHTRTKESRRNSFPSSLSRLSQNSSIHRTNSNIDTTPLLEDSGVPFFTKETCASEHFSELSSNFEANSRAITSIPSCSTKTCFFQKRQPPNVSPLKPKDSQSIENQQSNNLQSKLLSVSSTANIPATYNNYCIKPVQSKNDIDNHFEFTLEQEKIVSFVCSPSPPRKERFDSKSIYDEAQISDSDLDSDKQSEVSSIREDSLSDTFSNFSAKSNKKKVLTNDNCAKWDQFTNSNKLLWHLPLSKHSSETPLTDKQPFPSCSTPNPLLRNWPPENYSMMCRTTTLNSSISQEAILFREASLRGCYSIDSIVRDAKLSYNIESDVKTVKESIFSAVRHQPNHDSLLPDSVRSVLDILKAWVTLNSHFENKGFKDVLLFYGIELSVLSDFLKWQSVSRIFIDKMINALQRIASAKTVNASTNGAGSEYSRKNGPAQNFECSGHNPLLVNSNLSQPFNETQYTSTFPTNEQIQNKHWKQRRFVSDQTQSSTGAEKKLHKLNTDTNNVHNNSSHLPSCGNTEMIWRHGESGLPYGGYEEHFKKTRTTTETDQETTKLGILFGKNNSTQLNSSVKRIDKNNSLSYCGLKTPKEPSNMKKEVPPVPLNACNEFHDNESYLTKSFTFPIKSMYNNLVPNTNNNLSQPSGSQPLTKPNPIHCVDNDSNENCVKSSYIKPGIYNPPQKLVGPQKSSNNSNNNIPIEDTPVVGIPVLYWHNTDNPQVTKTKTKLRDAYDNCCDKKCDDAWKAAVSLAESFRDTLMNNTTENGPNLKLSETISLKTHFLLSDEISQHSSSFDYKLDSETEELCPSENNASEKLILRKKKEDSKGLFKSMDKVVVEKEPTQLAKQYIENKCSDQSEYEQVESRIYGSYFEKEKLPQSNNENVIDTNEPLNEGRHLNPRQSNQMHFSEHINQSDCMSLSQKKPKKNKRVRDGYMDSYDHKTALVYRKPKSIFKKAITKQVTSKLETILDCIWNVGVSNLVEEDFNSGQDAIRIELKIRSPLYLQAMRCKLTNHSYDTLEQALSDFHQYFMDIKSRNQGDKKCEDVVGVLEQMFFDLVEKNFGPMYQPLLHNFSSGGMSSSVKPRRQKKSSRKC